MPASPKLETLIARLIERTRAGAIKWAPASRDDSFIWSGTSASVVLSTKDYDGEAPFVIRLVDDSGRTVEEVVYDMGSNRTDLDLVKEFYHRARSSALSIDDTIEGLLADLE